MADAVPEEGQKTPTPEQQVTPKPEQPVEEQVVTPKPEQQVEEQVVTPEPQVRGTTSRFVNFRSLDGFDFHVPLKVVNASSQRVVDLLGNPGPRPAPDHLLLHYQSRVVNTLCLYMLYKHQLLYTMDEQIPHFEVDYCDAFSVLDAAMFLEL